MPPDMKFDMPVTGRSIGRWQRLAKTIRQMNARGYEVACVIKWRMLYFVGPQGSYRQEGRQEGRRAVPISGLGSWFSNLNRVSDTAGGGPGVPLFRCFI